MAVAPRLAILRVMLVSVLAVLAVAACFRSDVPEVRLGFVATFSGEDFRSGRDALEAARFAVDQAVGQGRPTIGGRACRIRLLVRDDLGSPEEAAKVVRELATSEHVTAVIGPYASGLADAAAKAAEAVGVPLVTPSATAAVVTAGRPHIFRIAFTDEFQGMVLGRLAVRELGLHQVSVVANADNLASRSLAAAFGRAFTACGGEVSLFTYPDRDRDFRPLLRQALAKDPQALFLPNPNKEVVLQGLAARSLGFTGALLGGDSWNGPEVSSLSAFKGAVFVDHWREDAPGKTSKAYAVAFRKALKRPATELGALTQDAVDVVLDAVAQAGSIAPKVVTRALIALPPHDGVTGRFDFENDGNPIKSLCLTRVTGNDGTSLESVVVPPPEPCQ